MNLYLDASGSFGCGAWFDNFWLAQRSSRRMANCNKVDNSHCDGRGALGQVVAWEASASPL